MAVELTSNQPDSTPERTPGSLATDLHGERREEDERVELFDRSERQDFTTAKLDGDAAVNARVMNSSHVTAAQSSAMFHFDKASNTSAVHHHFAIPRPQSSP